MEIHCNTCSARDWHGTHQSVYKNVTNGVCMQQVLKDRQIVYIPGQLCTFPYYYMVQAVGC